MKDVISGVRDQFDIAVEEINIEDDPALFVKYGERIPVLTHRDRIVAKYSISREQLYMICKSLQDKS
jgi:hypothetical protein